MKTLTTVCVAGIASFTLACVDHPTGLPTAASPSKPSLGETTPFNNSGQCLGDDAVTWNQFVDGMNPTSTPADLNCTSLDVSVASLNATEYSLDGVNWIPLQPGSQTSCTEGSPLFLKLTATLAPTTTAFRFDTGLWLATGGGNAISGSCNHYNLPVNPLAAGAANVDGDSCGDVSAESDAVIDLGVVETVCHAGASGQLELGTCVAWTTAATDRVCPVASMSGANAFRAGTLPGTVSQCNCQPVVITPGGSPTGSITIVTDAVPNDAQDFSFLTTGGGLSTFALDDDSDGTLPNIRTFSGLLGGTFTVAETATPGFDLTSLVCTAGGSGDPSTRTATITLAPGANVTCTFVNTKRASVSVNKRESGALPLTRAWEFQIRAGASTSAAGTAIASGSADLATGAVSFSCSPNPNSACENVGGTARIVPGSYQLCEINMPAGYSNNVAGFTPAGSVAEGGSNAAECIGISLSAGATGVPAGVTDPINNIPPAISGGSISLQTGSFTLVSDILSGDFGIRNSSTGTQQVFVTNLTIVNATFRDGSNIVQAAITGCVFSPLPVTIPASATQSIALTGCQVSPPVRKELMFTVRATINGGTQPYYERTYKSRVQ